MTNVFFLKKNFLLRRTLVSMHLDLKNLFSNFMKKELECFKTHFFGTFTRCVELLSNKFLNIFIMFRAIKTAQRIF